jgi:hypothetical protein
MSNRKAIPRTVLIELIKKRGVKCEMCEACNDGILNDFDEISHKDEDPSNNSLDNLQLLCKMCHYWYHYQMKVERKKEKDVQYDRDLLKENEDELKVPFEQRKKAHHTLWAEVRLTDEQLIDQMNYLRNDLNKGVKEQLILRKDIKKELVLWRRGDKVPDRA